MTEEQKAKCRLICEHYGIESQKGILTEECAELIQAVSKLTRQMGRIESDKGISDNAYLSKRWLETR